MLFHLIPFFSPLMEPVRGTYLELIFHMGVSIFILEFWQLTITFFFSFNAFFKKALGYRPLSAFKDICWPSC